MAWAGIIRGGRTDLHIVMRCMMTGVRYREEILDIYVRRYTGAIGPHFIFMDDNACSHLISWWLRTASSQATDRFFFWHLNCFGHFHDQKKHCETSIWWGVRFLHNRMRVTYCSNLVYSNDIQEINMSSRIHAILSCCVIPMPRSIIPP